MRKEREEGREKGRGTGGRRRNGRRRASGVNHLDLGPRKNLNAWSDFKKLVIFEVSRRCELKIFTPISDNWTLVRDDAFCNKGQTDYASWSNKKYCSFLLSVIVCVCVCDRLAVSHWPLTTDQSVDWWTFEFWTLHVNGSNSKPFRQRIMKNWIVTKKERKNFWQSVFFQPTLPSISGQQPTAKAREKRIL